LDPNRRQRLYLLQISLIFNKQCNNHQQNNIVISVDSRFVLNGALQLEQSIALTFAALHRVNWNGPCGSVFVQQAPDNKPPIGTEAQLA